MLETEGCDGRRASMSMDVSDLRAFYASPLGGLVQRTIARAVLPRLGNVRALSVLGLGYAVPLLGELDGRGARLFAFMPGCQGVVNWPAGGRSSCALVDPLTLPLPDGSVDRVVAVHAIEAVENPSEFLHEIGRVLTPGGRAILVCPNRRGLWSRMDRTPFGHGQPYSRSQLRHLLKQTQFAPESWTETLYVPPFRNRLMLRGAAAWEAVGRGLSLPFAGLHVVEAAREIHRPVAVRIRERVRHRRPVLVQATAGRAVACDGRAVACESEPT